LNKKARWLLERRSKGHPGKEPGDSSPPGGCGCSPVQELLAAANGQPQYGGFPVESQVFDPKAFSLSPIDLIPPDDDVAEDVEADARQARYARLGRLVDVEDILEMVCCRLKDSAQLRYLVEDAIAAPHDPDRPRIHVNDALKMAQDVLVEVVTAVDEQISVLDVVEGD
jgi:hypothetical protein